jgi:hypothetical protein
MLPPTGLQFISLIVASLLIPPVLPVNAQQDTVTMTEEAVYSQQRPCATNCVGIIYFGVNTEYLLAGNLGCNLNPLVNSCFCRADLQAQATYYLETCISSACSGDTLDIASATSIYLANCTSNGYTTNAAIEASTTGTSHIFLITGAD